MPEVLGSAVIDVSVNANSVNQSLNKLKQNVTQTATIIDKKFAASFNRIAEATSRMGRMASNSLRAIAIPMIGAVGIGIKKYMDSGSAAANQAKAKFDELKKSLDAVGARLGKVFLESKVLGKTPLEWVDKLISKLNSVTDEQLKSFIDSLKKILGLFVALKATIAGIEVSKSVIQLLSEIPKAAAAQAAGQATGQALGTALGGGAGAGGSILAYKAYKNASEYRFASKPRSTMAISEVVKLAEAYKNFDPSKHAKLLPGSTHMSINSKKLMELRDAGLVKMPNKITTIFRSFTDLFNKLPKSILKIVSIGGFILKKIPIIMIIWDALVGAWQGIKDSMKPFKEGDKTLFSGVASAFRYLSAILTGFSTYVQGLVRTLVNVLNFGEGWKGRVDDSVHSMFDKLGKIIYEAVYAEEAELAKKIQAQVDANTNKGKEKPSEDALLRVANLNEMLSKSYESIENINSDVFDKMKEKSGNMLNSFIDMFQKEKDRESIIERTEKKQIQLKEEANNITRAFNQSMRDLEEERMQAMKANSGIFLGGMEAIKLSQQIEAGSGTREAEYKKRVEELTKKNNEELEENNSVLDTLNKNFTQFFQLINKGRDALTVSEALGL